MYAQLSQKIKSIFGKGDQRTANIVKNIFVTFIVKSGNIIIGLLLVPLTIDYINPFYYGIWLTVSSIINWMSFFDIGLSNGLRFQITSLMSTGNFKEAKIIVSTTYAVLTIISVILMISFGIGNSFVNWNSLFNIPKNTSESITSVVTIILISFCVQFIVQIINSILTAFHQSAKSSIISFVGQLGVLIGIFFAKKYIPPSLHALVWIITWMPIVTLIIASIILFRTTLRNVSPSIRAVDFRYAKKVFNVGLSFFLIQIGAIVLLQTDNIVITKVMGPEHVTEFNVVYKLFSVITMVFTVIIIPYWSAFTDAFVKEDYTWMKNSIKYIRLIATGLTVAAVLLYLCSPFLFKIWVGSKVSINKTFCFFTLVYVIVMMWYTGHVYFLNGTGKIRLQLITIVIGAIINIPLAFYLGHRFGLSGIVSSNTIIFFLMAILFTYQTEKILNRTAIGIWFK